MSSDISQAKSVSTTAFVTALVLNAAVFGIQIVVFTIVRRKFKVIYSPRTFIPIPSKRSESFSNSLLSWPVELFKADYDDIRRQNGLDAYVFVRFLRMMVKILLPIWFISWAVLLPVSSVGSTRGLEGLDRFTFGNTTKANKHRYAAHTILVWIFTLWIIYVVKGEMRHFITVRQRHLIDPAHASSAQASTILITGVPRKYLENRALKGLFSHLPGGVKKSWINRDLKELPDLHDQRLKIISKLESSETAILKYATKDHLQKSKKVAKNKEVDGPVLTPGERIDPEQHIELVDKLIPRAKRPSHRLKPSWLPFGLPFMGQKVDTIDWCRDELARLNREIVAIQQTVASEVASETAPADEKHPPLNSAFILFNSQVAAHLAAQSLTHHEPYRMTGKYTEVASEDIIWSNLSMNPYESKVRMAISYAATAALIIFWAIPVAFVGSISNVPTLCEKYGWLAWLCTLPDVVNGIIAGVLPPVALAVLMMLLPIVLRLFARFEGIPRHTGVELSLMTRFFIFQVIHSFLIVSLSSGIIKALPQLSKDLSSAPKLLAENLPGASTFFLTYIILQGLAGAAGGLLQAVRLIIYYIKLYLLGSTPRSVYTLKNAMPSVQWGTLFPNMTLIMVITFGYSIISPIINGLACVAFFLFFQVWKYLFLYEYDQPPSSDTGGLFFPKAITHVFVGLYVQQLCLAALLFLAVAIPEGIIVIVLIVVTIGFHLVIIDSYSPLLHSLPLSLADKSFGAPGIVESGSEGESDPLRAKDFSGAQPSKGARTTEATHRESDDNSSNNNVHDPNHKGEAKREEGITDFTHPALQPARTVWLPQDTLGLTEGEVRANRQYDIDVSSDHAFMNEKGRVDVDYYPPGEKPSDL